MKELEQKIKELGRSKTYAKDEFLFHADDPAEGFYYLLSGEVSVFNMDEQGKELEVVRLSPGDFFGEAIVFVKDRYPSYAQAVKDSQVIYFEKETFFPEPGERPRHRQVFSSFARKKMHCPQ